ncbi:MAG: 50S ribosomal protein L35 [Anaerococcus sp.]|jgi:large subunit ribosomal protein L35|nr:50S ribosomal protein L35 [Peptoniphilaceae bacterium]MDY3054943.1 50S ribosomal protein L35 [Anaerococcus sp.]
MAKNKMKTRRAAAKRFKVTGSGKLKRNKAYKGHLTAKKSPARKRRLRKSTLVSKADEKRIKELLHN